jgi:hypothetical protein
MYMIDDFAEVKGGTQWEKQFISKI